MESSAACVLKLPQPGRWWNATFRNCSAHWPRPVSGSNVSNWQDRHRHAILYRPSCPITPVSRHSQSVICMNVPGAMRDMILRKTKPGAKGSVYAAIRGQGTVRAPLDRPGETVAVRVSTLREAAQARLCESVESGHSSHDDAAAVAQRLGITTVPVRLDSQAKYAVVARGDAEIYLRLPTRPGYVEKIWDHAAGSLVVTEAGGVVTDVAGLPLAFHHGSTLRNNRGIVVTNGPLHAAVLAALEAVGVG
ncbi:MAG: hypothetical protein IH820_18365 [Bacteroidetes bacterium]|nr:hypothetical protein [Bacteroidota bacterium]